MVTKKRAMTLGIEISSQTLLLLLEPATRLRRLKIVRTMKSGFANPVKSRKARGRHPAPTHQSGGRSATRALSQTLNLRPDRKRNLASSLLFAVVEERPCPKKAHQPKMQMICKVPWTSGVDINTHSLLEASLWLPVLRCPGHGSHNTSELALRKFRC